MSDRSRQNESARRDRQQGNAKDASRITGDGGGERGYRGDTAPDTPPGSVPGGSYGAGGGYRQGDIEAGDEGDRGSADEEEPERRSASSRTGEDERQPAGEAAGEYGPRTGYGVQGFGAGEGRSGNWGGGPRGGYGGGQPGGVHGSRGGGWAAEGRRFEQGRGPRSYGVEGWGAGPERVHGWGKGPRAHRDDEARVSGGSRDGRGGNYPPREAPWTQSEFAGRGEFGSRERGESPLRQPTRGPQQPARRAERWDVPGPHTGRGPQGYHRSETAIREDVCERLTRHGLVDASGIVVNVENGEVVLEGTVDSRRSKRLAEDAADTVAGVRDVHNRLRIENVGQGRDEDEPAR